jgi:F-type H+-transporting ATPase subunit epsilon
MSGTLKLEIITPAETAYSADVQMVTLPAIDGQIAIYPSHVALLTRMLPGELIVRKDGRDEFLAVGEGLVEITGDHVAVVTDLAIAVDKSHGASVEDTQRHVVTNQRISSLVDGPPTASTHT